MDLRLPDTVCLVNMNRLADFLDTLCLVTFLNAVTKCLTERRDCFGSWFQSDLSLSQQGNYSGEAHGSQKCEVVAVQMSWAGSKENVIRTRKYLYPSKSFS